ncbi:hypothetical protein [Nostoc sp. CALU 1950]|uniref:hypothetical protein n=1 Tax=Nostoc sp. CALU 1950 TaxID=3104321 RepID=UPI003EC12857
MHPAPLLKKEVDVTPAVLALLIANCVSESCLRHAKGERASLRIVNWYNKVGIDCEWVMTIASSKTS